jgi:hypothetical protein
VRRCKFAIFTDGLLANKNNFGALREEYVNIFMRSTPVACIIQISTAVINSII